MKTASFFKKTMPSTFRVVLLILLLVVLQQTLCSPIQASGTTFNNETDGDTLLAFKASLSNQWGAIVSWNRTSDFCRWQGISCSLKHKHRVIELNLSSQGLAGTIAPLIGNLTFLRSLDLSGNNFHGEIPSAIGHLSRLRYLDLSNNSFHGEVSANLKNCTRLGRMDLNSNRLTGEIPAWLGSLSNLMSIRMSKNNFSGRIPPSLANLSALHEIYLLYNQLEGSIPEGFGRLHRAEYVNLGENQLSGTIPPTLFNISSLTHFSLAMNELHGTLPSHVGNRLCKLKYLLLGMNHLTGTVPASLVNATELYILDQTHNNFTGSLPPDIGKICPYSISIEENQLVATTAEDWQFMTFLTNCTRLRYLALAWNKLGGMLPSSVANLSGQLQVLAVGYNEISGNIPYGISNLVGLTNLQLSSNQLTGVLSDSIGKLNSLQNLEIDSNLLKGFMPSCLGNLTELLNINASHNMFEGPLPISLGSLQKITVIAFNNNNFTGLLPVNIFNLSSLSNSLDLSGNNFVGPLPPEVSSLTKLEYLDISRNHLSGPLPDALSSCQSLIGLSLGSNSFNSNIPASISKMKGLTLLNLTKNTLSGVIPQEIGLMSGIEELYLSHNNLSGQIPESFGSMTSMYRLDLSFNKLDGCVSKHGVFSNVTGVSLDGNVGLCGGNKELHLPPCLPKSVNCSKRKLHLIFRVIVPIAGAFLCFSVVLISISLRKKAKAQTTTLPGLHFIDNKYPRVSYADLVQGTNGFDINHLIGSGRYGSVYKCSLQLENVVSTVAVKVFDLQQSGSSKSFIAECETLTRIRHRNLISIITCCSSMDTSQNNFKALVFEFMPNGSLDSWLHPDVEASPQRQGLTLTQRLNIAVDVAEAIDYLHDNSVPHIVHCDLKPSNILLNQDLVAHVGDFGLAKIFSESASEHLINSESTIGIRGTIGYVAPEYGEGGQVSPCGDVYSYGIVIFELFTGMVPTHNMFRDGLTLLKHAENALPGMLMKIDDPVLLSTDEAYANNLKSGGNAMEDISEVMLSTTKLALSCCKQAPTERMCMRDVAAEMHRIRDRHVKRREAEGEVIM